ncbi:response regulator receiver domain [Streptomyces sp. NPDC102394]|uniref:response regulator receiver domain n=1 Tax=Streptomyces sp. NPDC102394 TaxID=3366167 RepID=UPI0038285F7D
MSTELEQWSVNAARDYLQTVVVVDDQVAIEPAEGSANSPGPEDVVEDIDALAVEPEPEGGRAGEQRSTDSHRADETSGGNEDLDGAALSEAFAGYGLVCGYVRPKNGDQRNALIEGSYDRLFLRADVLVLDWTLNGDTGQTTSRLVSRLVRTEQGKLGRLRLICIYTNDPDLYGVRDTLQRKLKDEGHELEISENGDGLGIIARDFRISVLGKPGVSRPGISGSSAVSEAELPERIVREFAQASHGILPGFALQSLSLLRDNAPALLQRFRSDLDPAFVSHDLLTGEGKRFAIQLIAREIQSLLESTGAGDMISRKRIESWVKARLASGEFVPQVQGKKRALKDVSPDSVLELLTQEKVKIDTLRDSRGGQLGVSKVATIASLFTTADRAWASEEELGRLSCFARDLHSGYTFEREPTLQLGTILVREAGMPAGELAPDPSHESEQEESKREFLLCLQPLCDSERLELDERRGFPMIPLSEVELGKEFHFLAFDDGKDKRALAVTAKPHQMMIIPFRSTVGEGVVRAIKRDGIPRFNSDDGEEFLWVGELRPEHALRVSHELGRLISRVGLDESEWLRYDGFNR